ncbi:unnamed protein product, partial [marine sediment metagenome]
EQWVFQKNEDQCFFCEKAKDLIKINIDEIKNINILKIQIAEAFEEIEKKEILVCKEHLEDCRREVEEIFIFKGIKINPNYD